jgi:hypothetical protein
MLRGRCRGSSAGLREFTSQRARIEARDLRSKDVVASANIDRLQEFLFPKSPECHWGQSRLLNEFIKRHRWFGIQQRVWISFCFVIFRVHATYTRVNQNGSIAVANEAKICLPH